jgi:hypothetical protein
MSYHKVINCRDVPLYIEYEIKKSSFIPHKNYYYINSVKLIDSDIELMNLIGEGTWVELEKKLREYHESN